MKLKELYDVVDSDKIKSIEQFNGRVYSSLYYNESQTKIPDELLNKEVEYIYILNCQFWIIIKGGII